MFAEEKPHLQPLPLEPFRYYLYGKRTVHLDGENALPVVLSVIKSSSGSQLARENAVFVWMEVQRDSSPRAVAALLQEAAHAPDPVSRQNLKWAASRALVWCNPPDEAQCKAALSKAR